MEDINILQKNFLWIKSCELSRLLLDITNILDKLEEVLDLSSNNCKDFVVSISSKVSEGIIAKSIYDQIECYDCALKKARKVDEELHVIFERLSDLKDSEYKSELISNIFSAFIVADQLREMILNAQNDMEVLKKYS